MVVMNLVCILIPALLFQQVVDYFRHEVELPTKSGATSEEPEKEEEEEEPMLAAFNLKLGMGGDGTFSIINAKKLTTADGLTQGPEGFFLAPLPSGEPNYRALQRLLHKEKRERLDGKDAERYPDPDQITISGPVDMPYQKIIMTLDYLRFAPVAPGKTFGDPGNDMFTVISLSPGSVGG
jgi:hypothetical protein